MTECNNGQRGDHSAPRVKLWQIWLFLPASSLASNGWCLQADKALHPNQIFQASQKFLAQVQQIGLLPASRRVKQPGDSRSESSTSWILIPRSVPIVYKQD